MAKIHLVSYEALAEDTIQSILASNPLLSEEGAELSYTVDPSILGGYILYVDNRRIDNSLRTKLQKVKSFLDRGSSAEERASSGSGDGSQALELVVDEIGRVERCSDGIVFCSGLDKVMNNERLIFDNGEEGVAMNLVGDEVGILLIGDESQVRTGDICKRTFHTIQVPVGDELRGRVLDPLGHPIDGGRSFSSGIKTRPIEHPAPSVIDRQSVNEPIYTGLTVVDALIPIGKGQRELIIGDRQTGKTTIVADMILNQKGKNVLCVYVAIGQKMSTITELVKEFQDAGAMDYTTVVAASASQSVGEVYMAPYAACAIAEEWMEQGRDVLIVYDDLSKHAQAYRALSLLLRRPPGREAYPGDVFYIHSRLLERAAKLSDEKGGGSMTAIPIIETQGDDISAYIPTNVISITDGQIYLETDLFFAGQRPAVNVGLSVSRVGGDAQASVMRKTAGPLRVSLAQYRELEAFAQFGSDLDAVTRESLELGSRLNEVLKQGKAEPRQMAESVILLQLAVHNDLKDLAVSEVNDKVTAYLDYVRSHETELMKEIEEVAKVSDELYEKILASWKSWRQTLA